MDFLIQKAAKQTVLNKLADRRAVLAKTDADITKRRSKVRDDWKEYLRNREVALQALKEQREKDFLDASKAEPIRADMFCTKIDGRYVVATINVSTSASAPRPSATCVHIIAYEPLTRERAEVKLSGWEIFVTVLNHHAVTQMRKKTSNLMNLKKWNYILLIYSVKVYV